MDDYKAWRLFEMEANLMVGDETREAVDFHTEMEARMRMDW